MLTLSTVAAALFLLPLASAIDINGDNPGTPSVSVIHPD